MSKRFFNIVQKWCKFYNTNLSVILADKHGGQLNLVNPKHEDWASIQLRTFSLFYFLFYFAKMSSYFSMKTNKRKVRNRLKCVKEIKVVFQFFIQKYYAWQNNIFWLGIISTKNTMRVDYAERILNNNGQMNFFLNYHSILIARFYQASTMHQELIHVSLKSSYLCYLTIFYIRIQISLFNIKYNYAL